MSRPQPHSMILRPYQQAAIDTLWAWMRQHAGNPAIVIPTGGGKSPVMAAIARQVVTEWGGRVGIIAHTKELVQQNADKLAQLWPEGRCGIYSASLKRRDRFDPVLSLQIQSAAKKAGQLGRFDLLLVDEAHRIPLRGEGLYLGFIRECLRFNPQLRVVGLTATPYRLQGRAVPVCGPDNVLNAICYEVGVGSLIEQGFLSRLVTRAGRARADLSHVHKRGGEYVEAELGEAMNTAALVSATCDEILAHTADRRAIIVFAVTVAHAESVAAALRERGILTGLIHGGTPQFERDTMVAAFKSGGLRAMVNVNVLTEGFDATRVDCVAMLRPTLSPGLYYQMVGRGLRLHEGKADCLVLDFAGNMAEHGPIDAIRVAALRKGPAEVVKGAARECPECQAMCPVSARQCAECGHEFPPPVRRMHADVALGGSILSADVPPVWHAVKSVAYRPHMGKSGIATLQVTYHCGLLSFREWVCLEHAGFARSKAVAWWQHRSTEPVPDAASDAAEIGPTLRNPTRILVREAGRFPEILAHDFDPVHADGESCPAARDGIGAGNAARNASADTVRGLHGVQQRLLQAMGSQRSP